VELRDDWLLAQGRLGLPATSPDVMDPGRMRLEIGVGLGNDFGWDQDRSGEEPQDRRFLVDGEHGQLVVGLRRGLARRLDAELRLGLVWRNGGFLDGLIDTWHRWLGPAGVRDNARPFFETDLLRVEGRTEDGRPVVWDAGSGTALSNTELALRYALGRGAGWRTAVVGRLLVPTGTGSFGAGGWDVGAQLVAARPLSDSVELYLAVGATRFGVSEHRGIDYARGQAHGHLSVGWRISPGWTLHGQLRASSRLVDGLAEYPGLQSYVDVGAGRRLGRWWLRAGFTENILSQQSTVDFAVYAQLVSRF
jgi:hypothetical protein